MAWLAVLAVVCTGLAAALALVMRTRGRERAACAEREALLRDALEGTLGPAAIGTLAAAFAHSSNNRLTVMLAGLDLLTAGTPGQEDFDSAITLATGASRELADEMAALLAGARRQAEPPVPVDLREAALGARRLDGLLAAAPTPVTIEVPAGLTVRAEPPRLTFALLMLLSLGRRFGVATTHIAATAVEVAQRSSQRPGLRPGSYCRVEVRFEGASLPEHFTRPLSGPGRVVERLYAEGGPEFAAVEAFALASRGHVEVRNHESALAVVELFLPRVDAIG